MENDEPTERSKDWSFIWAHVHMFGFKLNINYYKHCHDSRTTADCIITASIIIFAVAKQLIGRL